MKGTGGKTQRLPRFLREYRGEVPRCPGGVGACVHVSIKTLQSLALDLHAVLPT